MVIRKAAQQDIAPVTALFDAVHTAQEAGLTYIGWARDVYPTRDTAQAALARDDLFVMASDGQIVGSAIINQLQVDAYAHAPWRYAASPDRVMVLHTLVISPAMAGKGLGSRFVSYYEEYARTHGCPYLRMDTNARNARARALYRRLGYAEIGVVPCVFNGIAGVQLVLLEKKLPF